MQAFGAQLTPTELAAVTHYQRNAFGNDGRRGSTAGRPCVLYAGKGQSQVIPRRQEIRSNNA